MAKDIPTSYDTFEHAVRSAVLAQLTNQKMVDAITEAVLKRLDAKEDAMLLDLLEQEETADDGDNISVDKFLQALKS